MSEKRPILERPVVRWQFTLADGTVLTREWSMAQMDAGDVPPTLSDPPLWLENRRRTWSSPQDPVSLIADVKAGHEADVRELISPQPRSEEAE